MKVTRRERNLLIFLGFIATISLVFMFVILPLQASVDTQTALKSNLLSQKALIDAQLLNGNGLENKVQKALSDVTVEFDKIESPITSEEFELRLQPLFVAYDIRIASWIVNDPLVTNPKLPIYENAGYVYKLKELVDNYNGTNSNQTTIPVTDAELLMTNIEFTFVSNYNNYIRVLDTIASWNTTVFVSSSSRNNSTGEAIVSIDFYSIEKP